MGEITLMTMPCEKQVSLIFSQNGEKEIVEDSTSVSDISIKMTCTKSGSGGFKRDFLTWWTCIDRP